MNGQDEFEGVEPIAIIGMSCRFPDADNINAFWDNLKTGKESVTFFSDEELAASGVDPELINEPSYVKACCIIDNIEMFDADFFGYTEKEAELIDPQQRFFLECAYEALEDSGYVPKEYSGDIGIFGAMKTSGYAKVLAPVLKRTGTLESFEAILGTAVDQVCLRVSHALDLKGPSIGVQTACSASIVAAHMACESLRNRECDMAIAGASAIAIPKAQGYLYDKTMITSPDGHCRAFDAETQGTIPGNGVGIVVLKPLADAIEDNDQIYSIIIGSAVNNDGSDKIGYRAPSMDGQTRVIEEALLMSGVNAESIAYVEANGTGTLLGDSIEIEALSRVFRSQTDKKQYCGIGSVKTNIGHLTQAAGVAALIKTAMALKKKEIPPSINCKTPNPKLVDSPFYLVKEATSWKSDGSPRRAGINSFAIGGTNAHMILEEPDISLKQTEEKKFHIFTISGKTKKTLKNNILKFKKFLESDHCEKLEDICFTSNVGRAHYPYRKFIVSDSLEDLCGKLNKLNLIENPDSAEKSADKIDKPKIAFVFSGIDSGLFSGSMSRFYYANHPGFKKAIDACKNILKNYQKESLITELLAGEADKKYPAGTIFTVWYSISQMFISWGIKPDTIICDGVGNYIWACLNGFLTLDEVFNMIFEKKLNPLSKDAFNQILENEAKIEKYLVNDSGLIKQRGYRSENKINYETYAENEVDITWDSIEKTRITHVIFFGDNNLTSRIYRNLGNEKSLQLADGDQDEWFNVLSFIGSLYVNGFNVNWADLNLCFKYRRISLPTYSFERKKYWFNQ